MGPFGWFVIGIIALNVFRAIAKGGAGQGGTVRPPRAPGRPAPRPARPRPRNESTEEQIEAWQQVLASMRTQPAPAPAPKKLAPRSKWEEGVSLEVASPEVVDHDEEAQAIVDRRIAAAEARNSALSAADHRAFDDRIRATQPAAAERTLPTAAELRRAFVWAEVLGKPVSER